MILPHEHDGCAPRSKDPTPPPVPEAAPDQPWRVARMIQIVIDIPAQDAQCAAQAMKCAAEHCANLELKVTLGGVPLPAKFV